MKDLADTEQLEICMEQPGDAVQVRDGPGQAEIHVEQPGDAVQVRDEPGQAEIRVEQPGDAVQVRDGPGQAEIRVEQPGDAVQARDEPRQAEICVAGARGLQQPRGNAMLCRGGARVHGRGVRGIRVCEGNVRGVRHHVPVPRHALLQPGILGPHLPPDVAEWQWNRIFPRGNFTPRHIPFTGRERIIPALPRNSSSLDFFKLYITEEMIDHLVTQTNIYAAQYIEREHGNLGPRSTVHQWIPTNRPEMLTLMGILILMGIIHKPRMAMYWSTDDILATPIFNQVMRRDRFLLLMRYIHFLQTIDSTIPMILVMTSYTNHTNHQ